MAVLPSQTLPLSRLYQKKSIDVHTTRGAVTDTIRVLGEKRKNVEDESAILYGQAVTLADELGAEFKIPRLTKKQTHRANVETLKAVVFYKRTIYIPLLENVIEDPRTRFPDDTLTLHSLFWSQILVTTIDTAGAISNLAARRLLLR